jgi:hypothetical protein
MKLPIALICLLTGLSWSVAQADRLPSHYPDAFQRTGTVDRVDFVSRQIVIGDSKFVLAQDAVLHSLSSQNDSLGRLIQGTMVGVRYSQHGRARVAEELWLLPSTYEPPSDALKAITGPIDSGL